jgi:hypothetical protein
VSPTEPRPQRQVLLNAPLDFFDHEPDGKPIWPCDGCLPWHIEVTQDPDGKVRIRHWHAIGCPVWEEDDEGSGG